MKLHSTYTAKKTITKPKYNAYLLARKLTWAWAVHGNNRSVFASQ